MVKFENYLIFFNAISKMAYFFRFFVFRTSNVLGTVYKTNLCAKLPCVFSVDHSVLAINHVRWTHVEWTKCNFFLPIDFHETIVFKS